MTDEHETKTSNQGSAIKLATSLPSMNWNRAGHGGIRTLLRGTNPNTHARQTTASPTIVGATEENEEHSIVIEKPKSSFGTVPSNTSDLETSMSISETGHVNSRIEDAFPVQVPAETKVRGIAQNDGVAECSSTPERSQIDIAAGAQLQSEETAQGRGLVDFVNNRPIEFLTSNHSLQTAQNTEDDTLKLEMIPLPESYEPINDQTEDLQITDHPTNSNEVYREKGKADLDVTEEITEADLLIRDHNKQAVSGKHRLHICNLPRHLTAPDLYSLFEKYRVEVVEIIQKHRGLTNEAYIVVRDLSAAKDAVDALSGTCLNDSPPLDIRLIADDMSPKAANTSAFRKEASLQTSAHADSITQLTDGHEDTRSHHDVITIEDGESIRSGEVSGHYEDDPAKSGARRAGNQNEEGEIIEIESDEDPMITNYSNAAQAHKPIDRSKRDNNIEIIDLEDSGAPESLSEVSNGTTTGPRTLAELTPTQLELQVRYFYITRDPNTIPETDLVRCTVCKLAGHLAPWCPTHICKHCNAKDVHFSKECPKIARCNRCRGLHSTIDCKHKLKAHHFVLVCDLCLEKGHVEADCELNWRSSGPLWKKPLPVLSVAKTCHICGGSGHLGNDCRLRQPGKQMGSSMWSTSGLPTPFTPITTSIDRPVQQPTGSRRSKYKMPNSKAKSVSAVLSRPIANMKSTAPFAPINKQNPADKNRGRPTPGSIKIKGLASRPNPSSSAYPSVQTSGQYQEPRNNHPSGYRNVPQQLRSYPTSDRPPTGDLSNGFPRGRNGDKRYRSRSRSRSPKGWYQAPLRSAGYGAPPRDYHERDDPRYSGPDSWRPDRR